VCAGDFHVNQQLAPPDRRPKSRTCSCAPLSLFIFRAFVFLFGRGVCLEKEEARTKEINRFLFVVQVRIFLVIFYGFDFV
jgi:hypothetical protein